MLTNTEVWAAATFKFDTIQARPLFFPPGVGEEEDKGGSARWVGGWRLLSLY